MKLIQILLLLTISIQAHAIDYFIMAHVDYVNNDIVNGVFTYDKAKLDAQLDNWRLNDTSTGELGYYDAEVPVDYLRLSLFGMDFTEKDIVELTFTYIRIDDFYVTKHHETLYMILRNDKRESFVWMLSMDIYDNTSYTNGYEVEINPNITCATLFSYSNINPCTGMMFLFKGETND